MSDELVFVVDENDNPLKPLPRAKVISEGLWRRTAGVLIVDPGTRKVLCQKRSEYKDERPGVWVSMFGGKCDPEEKPTETAKRELREEAGIDLPTKDFMFVVKARSEKHHQFEYLYWAKWSGDEAKLKYDPKEVSKISWYDIDTVIANLENPTDGWYGYGEEELATIRDAKRSFGN